ncbi:hypothetical protein R50073_04860 [Maricurvus nonylphenolicus]|uniref:KAP family P-loop NTPase fold protein n=1 Tax=Maricurvus nonylphenolicus TaxID=1008307 RepID=UPI0036F44DDC
MTAKESYSKAEENKAQYRDDLRFSEPPESTSTNETTTTPPSADPATPSRPPITSNRYLLSASLFLIAIIGCWLTTLFAPTPDNPFSDGNQRFSYHWWIEAQESNAPLKLPVYNILDGDNQIQAQGDKMLVAKADETLATTIDSAGTLTAVNTATPKQTISPQPSPQLPTTVITFEGGSTAITKQGRADLDALIRFIDQQRFPLREEKGYLPLGFEAADGSPQITELLLTPYVSAKDQKRDRYLGGNMTDTVQRILVKQGSISPYNITMQRDITRPQSKAVTQPQTNYVRVSFNPALYLPQQQSQAIPEQETTLRESINLRWKGENKQLQARIIQNDQDQWRLTDNGILQHQQNDNGWKTIAASHFAMAEYFGNSNWNTLTPKHYPSPIAITLALLFTGAGIVLLVMPVAAQTSLGNALDDFFISDAPIDDVKNDRLEFKPIALAMSRFLRNERTRPPLTTAIVGQWGCGKSSLMKLICNDLTKHQIRPVWVNAWHHQNETQFLAGLLERIRQEALPPTFSAANLIFQFNLLWLRVQKNPARSIAALALLIVPLGYWMTTGNFIIPDETIVSGKSTDLAKHSPWLSALMSFGITVSLVGTNIANLTGNTWFKKLIGANRKPLDLRSMIGLREQFIGEFEDLCKALSPTTLTIVIDDLDRCNEKRILDILETVNFLVSNGHCYVIMGMEEEPVVKAIANYYRNTHIGLSEEELQAKAHRYLEKLVNIEVPVPETSAQQSASLATPDKTSNTSKDNAWKKIALRAGATLVCTLALLAGGIYLGQTFPLPETSTTAADENNKTELTADKIAQTNIADDTGINPEEITGTSPENDNNTEDSTQLTYTPQTSTTELQWIILPLLITVLFFAYIAYERIRQRQRVVVTDSQQFETSMEKWSKAVGDTRPTPRRIKRFINRTRFLAMRQQQTQADFSEESLITLAGVYEIHPELFDSDAILDSKQVLSTLQQSCNPEHIKTLHKPIQNICKSSHQNAINGFKNWVRGIALR